MGGTNETARQNHDELFPDHVSATLEDPPIRQLAALIGCQALSEYRVMLGAALTAGVTPVEAREIVYQSVPYAGMGKAFDFIHATNDVLTQRGVQLPLDGQAINEVAPAAKSGLQAGAHGDLAQFR